MSAAILYTVRMRRKSLQRWARALPREIGAAMVAEGFKALLRTGDAAALKGLDFVRHVNARRWRKSSTLCQP